MKHVPIQSQDTRHLVDIESKISQWKTVIVRHTIEVEITEVTTDQLRFPVHTMLPLETSLVTKDMRHTVSKAKFRYNNFN